MTDREAAAWARALFDRSVLKQAKLREIVRAIDPPPPGRCLDLGGDNGVISHLLREGGGAWFSADVGARTTASIRALVGARVCEVDGVRLPFQDASFALVVVVDLMEHVPDDRHLALELARIVAPRGLLVVNVPHVKRASILNRVRHGIGLTDAWHGHVRPGYTVADLERLLGPSFRIDRARTYSRAFSETIDLALNAAYLVKAGKTGHSAKGTVVTEADMKRQRGGFAALAAVYPILRAFSAMDRLLPFQAGYKLVVRAVRTEAAVRGVGGA